MLMLTIDLESWVYADVPGLRELNTDSRQRIDAGYAERSVRSLIETLGRSDQRITFYVVSELWHWYPDAIEAIERAGHEIGWHTHTHRILRDGATLAEEIALARPFLARFRPTAFRAPTCHLEKGMLPVLRKAGFQTDSSVYGPTRPFKVEGVTEIPVTTRPYLGKGPRPTFPGALTLRLLSQAYPAGSGWAIATPGIRTSAWLDRIEREGDDAMLFLHNWQILRPTGATFPTAAWLMRHPTYYPYTRDVGRLFERLLRRHRFSTVAEFVKAKDLGG